MLLLAHFQKNGPAGFERISATFFTDKKVAQT